MSDTKAAKKDVKSANGVRRNRDMLIGKRHVKRREMSSVSNSRIMLVCKHCGDSMVLGKGDFGCYCTASENKSVELNDFFGKHSQGHCADDINCSENARDHFVILEEGEGLKDSPEVALKEMFDVVDELIDSICIMTGVSFTFFGKYAELRKKYGGGDDRLSKTLSETNIFTKNYLGSSVRRCATCLYETALGSDRCVRCHGHELWEGR